MGCDICGRKGELYRAIVEDVEMSVCQGCSSFGKVLGSVSFQKSEKKQQIITKGIKEKTEAIVEECPQIIKRARESLGLTQKEFAQKINEKESTVHKIETGIIRPSILMARKLERILRIKLIGQYKEEHEPTKAAKSEGMTLGDFIKLKNNKI